MKRVICSAMLVLLAAGCFGSGYASADSRGHRAAIKLCKQKYNDAVRGTKRLKGHQRKERIEQAQREREECEKLAPR